MSDNSWQEKGGKPARLVELQVAAVTEPQRLFAGQCRLRARIELALARKSSFSLPYSFSDYRRTIAAGSNSKLRLDPAGRICLCCQTPARLPNRSAHA